MAMTPLATFLLAATVVGGTLAALAIPDDHGLDICRPGYAKAHRLPASEYYPLAQRVFAEHGIAWNQRHAYQLDHRLPLCLGGSNDPGNLWPQPLAEAKLKDQLEAHACREVCAGRVSLEEAQSWFTHWQASYREVFR